MFSHDSNARRWLIRFGRVSLLLFMVFSTFAFLTAGMSTKQLQNADTSEMSLVPIVGNPVSEIAMEPSRESTAKSSAPSKSSVIKNLIPSYDRELWNDVIRDDWRNQLRSLSLDPAPNADWLTVCRRLSLSMVGSGLSLEEIRELQAIAEEQRIERHRQNLLNNSRFHDYWGERLTRFLVGADEGPFLVYRRRRFRTWLSDRIAENVGYDELARRLITAEGLFTDRPEVNFYTVTFDSGDGSPDPVRMAARVSRAFLGVRIDCLQCHDDFLGNVSMGDPVWMADIETASPAGEFREGKQQDFHQLAAFFTAADTEGLQGLRDKPAKYQYQYLYADEEQDVEPSVPFRSDLLPQQQYDKDARRRLAKWMTHPENTQFARAAVTRVWTLLFGRPPGDSEGVDDLPLDRKPTPMIMSLSRAFIESRYDLRELIRLITDSPAFRVDSRADFEITTHHEQAMAAFPIVRLRAEQVAGSLTQAARVKTVDRDSSFILQLQRFGETNDFLKRYGDLGEDEFKNETVTITQRLVMLNGKLTKDVANYNPVLNASAHVGMFATDDRKVVESLYLTNLNRFPTSDEVDHFAKRIGEGKREHAIEDLVWVLVNSSEFAWNH